MTYSFQPAAVIEIDGQRLTAAEAGLERLTVTLGLATHCQTRLELWPGSKFADARPGAVLSIELGDDDMLVFTGSVSLSFGRPGRAVIEGLDGTAPLSRSRFSTTFRDLSVADIVQELADRAGVTTGTIEGDLVLQAYAIDNRHSLWRHLIDLARLTGVDLSANPEGELRFAAGSGAVHSLRRGADLVDWRTGAATQRVPPKFAPHGAASAAGSSNWHHLSPDPLGEEPPLAQIRGVLRSSEAADSAASAAAIRAARAASGHHALTLGAPKIRPGDTVEIGDASAGSPSLPGADALGLGGGEEGTQYRAVTVCHRLDGASGFTTTLDLEGGGDETSLLGGVAALAGGLL